MDQLHVQLENMEYQLVDDCETISENNCSIRAVGDEAKQMSVHCKVQRATSKRIDRTLAQQEQFYSLAESDATAARSRIAKQESELANILAEIKAELDQKRSHNAACGVKLSDLETRLANRVGTATLEAADVQQGLERVRSEMKALEEQLRHLEIGNHQMAADLLKKKSSLEEKRAAYSSEIYERKLMLREQADTIASKESENTSLRAAMTKQEERTRQEGERHTHLLEILEDLQVELEMHQALMKEDKQKLEEDELVDANLKEKFQAFVQRNETLNKVLQELNSKAQYDSEYLKSINEKLNSKYWEGEERNKSWANEKETLLAGIETAEKSSQMLKHLEIKIQDEEARQADMKDKEAENDNNREELIDEIKNKIREQKLLSDSCTSKLAQDLAQLRREHELKMKQRKARENAIAGLQKMADEKKQLVEEHARMRAELGDLETKYADEEKQIRTRLVALQEELAQKMKDIAKTTEERRRNNEQLTKLQAEVRALREEDACRMPPPSALTSPSRKTKTNPRAPLMQKQLNSNEKNAME